MFLEELFLQGRHTIHRDMADGIRSRVSELRKERVRESFEDHKNIEHRIEFFLTIQEREFINDRKAPNVNPPCYALEEMTRPTVLIIGGHDKGNDYKPLIELVKEKVKAIVFLGKNTKNVEQQLTFYIKTFGRAEDMEEAIKKAYNFSDPGDAILLSPACASFDNYKDYEDRGRHFKRLVRQI